MKFIHILSYIGSEEGQDDRWTGSNLVIIGMRTYGLRWVIWGGPYMENRWRSGEPYSVDHGVSEHGMFDLGLSTYGVFRHGLARVCVARVHISVVECALSRAMILDHPDNIVLSVVVAQMIIHDRLTFLMMKT